MPVRRIFLLVALAALLPLLLTFVWEQVAIQQCLGAGGWDYPNSRCLREIGPDAPPGYAPFSARHRYLLWGTAASLAVSLVAAWYAIGRGAHRGHRGSRQDA